MSSSQKVHAIGTSANIFPDTSSLKHGFNLKRLGTVIRGRNRNSHMPYLRASSPDKRASSERLGTPKTGHPITPSFPSDVNSVNNSPRTASRGTDIVQIDSNTTPAMPALIPLVPEKVGEQNGINSRKGSTASNVPASPSIGHGEAPHPPSTAVSIASTSNEPQKDSEGYTIPPPTNSDVVSLAMAGGEELEEHTQPQFKVEIRNDVIHEEEEEADAAFSKVANSLRQVCFY